MEFDENCLFKDCAIYWLENYVLGFVKDNTYMGTYYYPTVNHLTPYFGNMLITDIKPSKIQTFFNIQSKKYSLETISKMKKCLFNILEFTKDEGIILTNPLNKRIRIKSEIPNQSKNVWNQEQYNLAFDFALTHPDGLGPLILMDIGISRSELLGIIWDHISLKESYVYICQSTVLMQNPKTHKHYVYTGKLKNQYRERIIPFSSSLVSRLKLEYQNIQLEGKRKGLNPKQIKKQFIIANKNGKAMDPSNWSKRNFKRFMDDLIAEYPSIPRLSPHELRHTRATLWFKENIDELAFCMVGGWCNLKMPRKLYVHNDINVLKSKLHR